MEVDRLTPNAKVKANDMKIKIQKKDGMIFVEFTTSTAKEPLMLRCNLTQAEFVISLLQTAVKSEAFTFELEEN